MSVVLFAIAGFNFLFLTFFIWYYKSRLDASYYLFSFFLLGKGLTLISNVVFSLDANHVPSQLINVAIILNSMLFFYAPFIYFFSLEICKGFSYKSINYLHFLPFVVFLILNVSQVVIGSMDTNSNLFQTVSFLKNKFTYFYFAQVIGYSVLSYKLLIDTEKKDSKFKASFKWFKALIFVFIVVWSLFLVSSISFELQQLKVSKYSEILGIISLIVLSNTTLFALLKNPQLFYNNLTLKMGSVENNEVITKENYKKLCDIVLENGLFRQADLKVSDLSTQMGVSTRNVSGLIKTYHDGNFYDFINSFRIEEAKKMLADENNDMTILSILYESGFNSKSVFNTTFKKVVGITPSHFREKNLELQFYNNS
ncbi:MAG: AraC family transcriptional regulator [Flavobacteriaceae bacterium]|nr:AraC family transcriptional regulator [Flavobacteriaceae bacterium]